MDEPTRTATEQRLYDAVRRAEERLAAARAKRDAYILGDGQAKHTITDLAAIFGISREALYKIRRRDNRVDARGSAPAPRSYEELNKQAAPLGYAVLKSPNKRLGGYMVCKRNTDPDTPMTLSQVAGTADGKSFTLDDVADFLNSQAEARP